MQQGDFYRHPPAPPGYPNPYVPYYTPPPPYELAGFGARFLAYLIDSIIMGILTFPINFYIEMRLVPFMNGPSVPLDQMMDALIPFMLVSAVVSFVAMMLYFTLQEGGKRNATLGKRLMNIKVARISREPVGIKEAFVRNFGRFVFIPGISSLVLLVDVILILSTDTQQRIGDRMAGTVVVKERRSFYHGPGYPPAPPQAYGPYSHPPYRPSTPQNPPYRRA